MTVKFTMNWSSFHFFLHPFPPPTYTLDEIFCFSFFSSIHLFHDYIFPHLPLCVREEEKKSFFCEFFPQTYSVIPEGRTEDWIDLSPNIFFSFSPYHHWLLSYLFYLILCASSFALTSLHAMSCNRDDKSDHIFQISFRIAEFFFCQYQALLPTYSVYHSWSSSLSCIISVVCKWIVASY